MTTSGEQLIEQIRTDLACPNCAYNLRGLSGAVVSCPECGTRCDVAKLMTRRWTGPWYRAPGFNKLLYPVTWLTLSVYLSGFVGLISMGRGAGIATFVSVVAIWCVLLWNAQRSFGNMRGFWLALLAHPLLVGYLVGIFGMMTFIIQFVMAANDSQWATAAIGLVCVAPCVAIIWCCRRAERYIAQQCIGRYLTRQSAAD